MGTVLRSHPSRSQRSFYSTPLAGYLTGFSLGQKGGGLEDMSPGTGGDVPWLTVYGGFDSQKKLTT